MSFEPDDDVNEEVNGNQGDVGITRTNDQVVNTLTDMDGEKSSRVIELEPITFIHLREDQLVKKHFRIKPPVKVMGNTTAILCNIPAYVDFLEISLCMHSYLHYSADLPDTIRSQTVVFERGMREFVKLFAIYFYRGTHL